MSSQLSIAAKKQYLEENGSKCPFCHSAAHPFTWVGDLALSEQAVFPRVIYRVRKCDSSDCAKRWKETYKLSDIEEIPNEVRDVQM